MSKPHRRCSKSRPETIVAYGNKAQVHKVASTVECTYVPVRQGLFQFGAFFVFPAVHMDPDGIARVFSGSKYSRVRVLLGSNTGHVRSSPLPSG